MRHAVLLDTKVSLASYNKWVKDDKAFWEEFLGMTPEYTLIRTDYSTYPTYIDNTGDIRPTDNYLKSLNDQVVAKLGEFGVDFVMVMIHEDNWLSDTEETKGIWGTNYSYIYGKQCLDYCRWDRDNSANTFGTAYHERTHSFDAVCKQEIGVDVNKIVGVTNWDREVTHGKSFKYDYIRHKENTGAIKMIAPHLRKAFSKREQLHQKTHDKMLNIIEILTQVVYLLKMLKNKKDGVSKGI